MSIATPFIRRPVATTLLSCGLALVGAVAYFMLPVAEMPEVDFPAIVVQAQLPGASPDTVSTSVTTPLERHLSGIAGVDEMTSSSSVGSARVVLVFDLDRDINGAKSDVQSAIEAARVDLPASLRQNPTYRAFNPADAPVLILALTSDTLTTGQVYNAASTIIQQKLLQIEGVGDVSIGGSSLPAVRIDLDPQALFKYGIGLEDVRAAISAANANSPKGAVNENARRYQIYVNDTATTTQQYRSLIIAYRKGAAVRLGDIAQVTDGVEDVRNLGLADGPHRSVLMIIRKQPGANVIDTVDKIKAVLPQIQASIPAGINLILTNDRTASIRASVRDVETTLLIALVLVVTVVLVMLRNPRAAIVPAIAVPLSLVGTFAVMYALGFSLNNLSLMALTVATGFVVDDAIVVIENIARHMEAGAPRMQAALDGASEVGFTVVSMSCSLIAVFIPILLMGGMVGRELREFATTLAVTVVLSLIVSLTTTPMLCSHVLRPPPRLGRFLGAFEHGFEWLKALYGRTLADAIRHPRAVMLILLGVVFLNFYLFHIVPKGFFPEESSGSLFGNVVADQSISFQAMQKKMEQIVTIVSKDAAVEHVVAFTGSGGFGGTTNTGSLFAALKPLAGRKDMSDAAVLGRLRRELAAVTGARLFLQSAQDIHFGGRQGNGAYQYTLLSDDLSTLNAWAPRITDALQNNSALRDVSSDRQQSGLDVQLQIDRATAARLGVNMSNVDNTLYDAFGQRQVSTIYQDMNQYHVVMEVAPQFWQSPDTLKDIYVSTSGGALGGTQATSAAVGAFSAGSGTSSVTGGTGSASSGSSAACGSSSSASSGATAGGATSTASTTQNNAAENYAENQLTNSTGRASTGSALSTCQETMVPLAAFSHYGPGITPLAVSHQGPFVATTFSFNLPAGEPLGTAVKAINATMQQLHVPISVQGSFAGTAKIFQQTLAEEPLLVLASLVAVYIVLGVLYESLVQPITILSTLPSSGIGAVLALLICGEPFTLIALIAVILLIGIVLKNAIMMVDVALETQRTGHESVEQAIHDACLLRFRPILMTTMAAMLGALPLAVMTGQGSELRRPLGIAIVGGLFISQILTLYTTPIVYIYLDRFRSWVMRRFRRGQRVPSSPPSGAHAV